jgi:hypothetical protein
MRIIYNTYALAKSASCRASCAKSISSLYGLFDVVILGMGATVMPAQTCYGTISKAQRAKKVYWKLRFIIIGLDEFELLGWMKFEIDGAHFVRFSVVT